MAPGGAWYNNRLEGSVVLCVLLLWKVVVVVAVVCQGIIFFQDNIDNFASHVTLAG